MLHVVAESARKQKADALNQMGRLCEFVQIYPTPAARQDPQAWQLAALLEVALLAQAAETVSLPVSSWARSLLIAEARRLVRREK
jgi:hypothetical protein